MVSMCTLFEIATIERDRPLHVEGARCGSNLWACSIRRGEAIGRFIAALEKLASPDGSKLQRNTPANGT
jgi:hypothetical protein